MDEHETCSCRSQEMYETTAEKIGDTIQAVCSQIIRMTDEDEFKESAMEPDLLWSITFLSEEYRKYFAKKESDVE